MKHLKSYRLYESVNLQIINSALWYCLKILKPKILFPIIQEKDREFYNYLLSIEPRYCNITNKSDLKEAILKCFEIDQSKKIDDMGSLLDPYFERNSWCNNNAVIFYDEFWTRFSKDYNYISQLAIAEYDIERGLGFMQSRYKDKKTLENNGFSDIEIDCVSFCRNLKIPEDYSPKWVDI